MKKRVDDIYLSDLDIPDACVRTIKQLDKMSKDVCSDEGAFASLSKYS